MTLPFSARAVLALAAAAGLIAPAAAQTAAAWNRGTPLTLTMTNRGYVPARLVLRAGRHYVLRIRNPSDRGHTFSAKSFFELARIAPRDAGWVARNDVVLKPGQSATLHLIAPTTPGALYPFRSTRVADAGTKYKGDIIVR